MSVLVVKLGGSNASAPELPVWLHALACAPDPVVVVPGGGPFADFVRDSQKRLGFNDATAHAMAILAMEQFGHLLLEREPRLAAARTLGEIRSALSRRQSCIWLPTPLALWTRDLKASWEVTSDSIAAWLADGLGSRRMLLVKQTDARPASIAAAIDAGIVDPAFAQIAPSDIAIWIAGPADAAGAADALARGCVPGHRLDGAPALRKAC